MGDIVPYAGPDISGHTLVASWFQPRDISGSDKGIGISIRSVQQYMDGRMSKSSIWFFIQKHLEPVFILACLKYNTTILVSIPVIYDYPE